MKTGKTEPERKCPKCGAVYALTEAKCPYCGYIHEAGAERDFMRRLEETRLKLDQVDDQAREGYRNEIRRNSKAILKRVLIVVIIIAAVAGFFLVTEHILFRSGRTDYKEEMIWQHEHFGELDQLYEKKQYKELEERLIEFSMEGHEVWDWEYYEEFKEIQSGAENGT